MTRHQFLSSFVAASAVVMAAGCGRGLPDATFDDARALTYDTLRVLLLGRPEADDATRRTPPDPPLLEKGKYEHVLLRADAEGFARVSRGSVSGEAVRDVEKRVAEDLRKDLSKRGFTVDVAPATNAPAAAAPQTLLVSLTPVTQEGGSPRERAEGRNPVYILIRLTVTDAGSNNVVMVREFYSGRDVKPATKR
jgi:hypothetical protein